MSDQFLNPYQFIPVKAPQLPGTPGWTALADFAGSTMPHQSHAAWVGEQGGQAVYSGRVLCRLETESPTVVGAKREKGTTNASAVVHPFKLNGQLALPASSLRGMVTAVHEAATNSSMRVMAERETLSYRRATSGNVPPLSAVGRVECKNGQWYVVPLALPTLEIKNGNNLNFIEPTFGLIQEFRIELEKYNSSKDKSAAVKDLKHLKFYLNVYRDSQPSNELNLLLQQGIKSYSENTKDNAVVYIKTTKASKSKLRSASKRNTVILGLTWDHLTPESFITKKNFESLTEKGLLDLENYDYKEFYYFGLGKRPGMPKTKLHELLIPANEAAPIPLPIEVINRFHRLADERYDLQMNQDRRSAENSDLALPYHPRGTPRNDHAKNKRLRLQHGDLVFFRVQANRDQPKTAEVSEVSYSQVWRGEVQAAGDKTKAATLFDFFKAMKDGQGTELLPFGTAHRSWASPSDSLFGFVDTRSSTNKVSASDASGKSHHTNQLGSAPAYAARVRFGFGLLDPQRPAPQLGDEVMLQILGSPKLPSSAMYFHDPNQANRLVPTPTLSPGTHQANGRKVYLHHPKAQGRATANFAATRNKDNLEQKATVKALPSGTAFWFSVDFDNLREDELGALLWSLRPDDSHRHRLGIGKPLGLGSVRVDIAGLYLVDRQARYSSDAFDAPRYQRVWTDPALACPAKLFPVEAKACQATHKPAPDPQTLKDIAGKSILSCSATSAVLMVGKTAAAGNLPVHYPCMTDQAQHPEKELFKWHMENRNSKQGLGPVSLKLPELGMLTKVQKNTQKPFPKR